MVHYVDFLLKEEIPKWQWEALEYTLREAWAMDRERDIECAKIYRDQITRASR